MLGCLALLMFGMKSMSEALQKMAGPQLRHVLGTMTTNRFTGMLTGMFVTASVQSSTATTLMTVSFVNAGLLTLVQAISIILGAHIGTTVTAWIMSLGFSFNIANFVYPAFFIGIILVYLNKKRVLGEFLFGVGFLFLGLTTLKETGFSVVQDPNASASISSFFAHFSDPNFFNSLFFLVMGTVLTLCVQSSAAIMAITMILCSTGVLHIDQGIMLVLGENIGTTITANIVALSANTQARRAALAHFTINVIGVIWVVIVLKWFLAAVCHVVGYDLSVGPGDEGYAANLAKISVVLATFHSAFNVSNTFIQIWFIKFIEKFVCRVIKPKNSEEEEDSRLHYISSGLMGTPELSLLEARKEISLFAIRTKKMFNFVPELLNLKEENDFVKLFARDIPYEKGLLGHSDADVLLHAISDALLGAAGLGDIGTYFPDTDPAFKGADSLELLRKVGEEVRKAGYEIVNIDSIVMCERPKVNPHKEQMKANIARVLGLDVKQIVDAWPREVQGWRGLRFADACNVRCMPHDAGD